MKKIIMKVMHNRLEDFQVNLYFLNLLIIVFFKGRTRDFTDRGGEYLFVSNAISIVSFE
jgi:hypothetical protein